MCWVTGSVLSVLYRPPHPSTEQPCEADSVTLMVTAQRRGCSSGGKERGRGSLSAWLDAPLQKIEGKEVVEFAQSSFYFTLTAPVLL